MKFSSRPGGRLMTWAPAKVNLFLEVLGKRPDGYHELETLMVSVSLYDTLIFQEEASGVIQFRCDDTAIPQGPTNLVARSALLIREVTGSQRCGVSIWLRKRIPVMAGLGGGSSDAASTIAALNALWNLGLSLPELSELGARIGSDVPFFFHTPVAVGRGRGEQVFPLTLPEPIHLVLVCPKEGVSTAEVFRNLSVENDRRCVATVVEGLGRRGSAELGQRLFNRLEPTASRLCPAILQAQEAIRDSELAGPLMTGSGSACFGLAPSRRVAVEAARRLRERFPGSVYVVRSTPRTHQ